MKRLQGVNKMLGNIIKSLLNMQTSSVDAFNEQFNQGPALQGENILMLAKSEYCNMLNENTWTGTHTKGSKSVFQAGSKWR